MMVLAVLMLLGQGAVVWLLFRFVKTFGDYTERLEQAVNAVRVLTRLAELQDQLPKKEVA